MAETLTFIFSSFWIYIGTVFLIWAIGYALAMPFFWYYKLKQQKMNRSTWTHQ